MKYLLGGTALLLLVLSSAAMADNVFNCQDVGLTTPEPIGDQDGHVLVVDNFSCRVEAGAMAGGVIGRDSLGLEQGKGYSNFRHGRDPQARIAGHLQGWGRAPSTSP